MLYFHNSLTYDILLMSYSFSNQTNTMKKIFYIIVALFLTMNSAQAQNTTVSGKVTDSKGAPLEGVTIKEKGTNNATKADAAGAFKLSVKPKAILQFSATGFAAKEVSAANASNVSLSETVDNLSEVVVTALGVKREKKALGYSIQEVKGENLTVAKSVDVSSSLVGKVAGVQLIGSPSSTFDNADIIIRGVTGLGLAAPIFVVDGTITNQSAVIMDNIENISVLKGPAATALYGQRAANGAVVISTKKGSRKRYTSVDVNLGTTFEKIALLPSYQNSYAGGNASSASVPGTTYDAQGFPIFKYNAAVHPASWASYNGQKMLDYGVDESWGPKLDGSQYRPYWSWFPGSEFGQTTALTPQPNNVRDFFETGLNMNNSIALTNGSEAHNFRFSYQNQKRTLVIPNASRDQHQFGLNGSYDIGSRFTISNDITYTTSYTKGQPNEGYLNDGTNITQNFNQWFQRQLDIKRMRNYREADGSLNSWNIGNPNSTGNLTTLLTPAYWDNPYFIAYEDYSTNRNSRLVGNIGLTAKVNSHINVQSNVRINTYTNETDQRMAAGGCEINSYWMLQNQYRELNYETNITYKNKFGAFSVDGLVGGNARKNYYSQLYMATAGGLSSTDYFDIAASVSRPVVSRSYDKKNVNSVYGKASVGWKDMVFVDGTLRNDWSSSLPANANSYLYPSLSGSFIFTELLKTSWLSYGKLRLSYASVGSDLAAHSLDLSIANGSFYGSNPSAAIGDQFRGGGIRPALTKAYEAGIELKFFKKVGLDVTVYENNNTDQILGIAVAPASGFSTAQINAGNIQSRGIEVSISGKPVQTKDFTWETSINFAKNQNKVVELASGISSYLYYSTTTGNVSLEHRVGGDWGVFYARKWNRNAEGKVLVDATGLPTYSTNQQIGNVLPKFTGGMFNTFKYKNFDLSMSMDFQSGGLFFCVTRFYGTGAGLTAETVGVNEKGNDWRDFPGAYTTTGGSDGKGGIRIPGVFAPGTALAGQENNRYIPARSYFYTSLQRDASNYILDASYIKLREVRFGYSIPSSLLKKVPFAKSANLGVIVQNAWLIWANTKKYGIDPSELESFYREGGQLSSTRQYGLNLRVSF